MKTSIRDLVRREKWATAYECETAAARKWNQKDQAWVAPGANTRIRFEDDDNDTVTFTIRLPWPDREWIDAVLASNASDLAALDKNST